MSLFDRNLIDTWHGKAMLVFFAALTLFLVYVIWVSIFVVEPRERAWCAARGWQYHELYRSAVCVDPNTRQLYAIGRATR